MILRRNTRSLEIRDRRRWRWLSWRRRQDRRLLFILFTVVVVFWLFFLSRAEDVFHTLLTQSRVMYTAISTGFVKNCFSSKPLKEISKSFVSSKSQKWKSFERGDDHPFPAFPCNQIAATFTHEFTLSPKIRSDNISLILSVKSAAGYLLTARNVSMNARIGLWSDDLQGTGFRNSFSLSRAVREFIYQDELVVFVPPLRRKGLSLVLQICHNQPKFPLLFHKQGTFNVLSHLLHFEVATFDAPKKVNCVLLSKPLVFAGSNSSMLGIIWESNCNAVEHKFYISSSTYSSNGFAERLKSENQQKLMRESNCGIETVQTTSSRYLHRVYVNNTLGLSQPLTYQVQSGSFQKSQIFTVSAPPKSNEDNIKVAVIGDSQYGARRFRQHVGHIAEHKPDMFVHLGDMVHAGDSSKEWRTYWTGPLEEADFGSSVPILVTRGNHDGNSSLAYSYALSPSNSRWFSIVSGGVKWIILDTNILPQTEAADEQTSWLENELSSPSFQLSTFSVVFLHTPPYIEFWAKDVWFPKGNATNGNGFEGERKEPSIIREVWVPLFISYGVDLVVGGHSHIYQRGELNSVTYVICGGGGAKLEDERVEDYQFYKVTEFKHHFCLIERHKNVLSVQAFDLKGKLFDDFAVRRRRRSRSTPHA